MSRRGWLLFLALSVIWGIPYLMIKIAVAEMSPAFLVFARTLVAGLALLPVALIRHEFAGLGRVWRAVVGFTLIEVAVPWVALGYAEQQISSSLTALLLAAVPMVALLASRAVGLERSIAPIRVVGLVIGAIGVAVVAGLDVGTGAAWAVLAVLVAVVGYAVAPVLSQMYLQGVSGVGITTASMLLTAALYAPWGLATRPASWGSVSWSAWASVIGLGLICSALAFVLFFQLVAEVGPARMSLITYVNPVVAAAAGTLILNERLTPGLLLGFPLVLLGSYLATLRPSGSSDPDQPASAGSGAAQVG